MSDRKLTHIQAYLLGSIAKHADHYRRTIGSLNDSVQEGLAYGPRRGLNMEAARKAYFASQMIEELLDNTEEAFDAKEVTADEVRQLTGIAMTPSEFGHRRRYHEGDEY